MGDPDIPFIHTQPTPWRRVRGLAVPCDGPHTLALDASERPVCGDCGNPVQRIR